MFSTVFPTVFPTIFPDISGTTGLVCVIGMVTTAGMSVIGSGVPTGTYVTAVSGTAVTLSQATTSTLSTATAFTFTGSPEVLVKFNFGYHAYYAAAGV